MLLSGKNPFPGRNKEEIQNLIVTGTIDMNKPVFAKVSSEAKEFISKCLIKDVDQRYSAAQLLEHPWLVGLSDKIDKDINDEDKKEVLQNLENFSKATKF